MDDGNNCADLGDPLLPVAAVGPSDLAAADEAARFRRLFEEVAQKEAEARRAVALLNAVIDQLPVGVTVQAEDGAVVLTNRHAANLSWAPDVRDTDCATITTAEQVVQSSGAAPERTLLVCERPAQILGRSVVLSTALDFSARKQVELALSKRAYFD